MKIETMFASFLLCQIIIFVAWQLLQTTEQVDHEYQHNMVKPIDYQLQYNQSADIYELTWEKKSQELDYKRTP